ncbi:MAG TPA: hypothetical protein VLT36_21690, partial [Candidatus Dormibacteraeota bacterium]|nr:hypothetical protein [Candidatus Dormibacteraeota bacterium]
TMNASPDYPRVPFVSLLVLVLASTTFTIEDTVWFWRRARRWSYSPFSDPEHRTLQIGVAAPRGQRVNTRCTAEVPNTFFLSQLPRLANSGGYRIGRRGICGMACDFEARSTQSRSTHLQR